MNENTSTLELTVEEMVLFLETVREDIIINLIIPEEGGVSHD